MEEEKQGRGQPSRSWPGGLVGSAGCCPVALRCGSRDQPGKRPRAHFTILALPAFFFFSTSHATRTLSKSRVVRTEREGGEKTTLLFPQESVRGPLNLSSSPARGGADARDSTPRHRISAYLDLFEQGHRKVAYIPHSRSAELSLEINFQRTMSRELEEYSWMLPGLAESHPLPRALLGNIAYCVHKAKAEDPQESLL